MKKNYTNTDLVRHDITSHIDWELTLEKNNIFDKISYENGRLSIAYINPDFGHGKSTFFSKQHYTFIIHPNAIIVRKKDGDGFEARLPNTQETTDTLKESEHD